MTDSDEVFLPTRDFLRQLLGQTAVKSTDIKNILRSRGVFTCSNDKDHTALILIKTGVSPEEFSEIKDNLKTKEETPKSKTRTIGWNSSNNLIDCIPENFDPTRLLNDKFGTLRLSNITNFTSYNDNPNHIYLDFEIERDDLISNLGKNTTRHKGRIELRKDESTNSLNISLTHTAAETMDFGNKLSQNLIQEFKNKKHINQDEEVITIKFSDFENASRVKFLQDLSQNPQGTILKFKDTDDIHFAPDMSISNLPDDINWMQDKIDDLKLKGKDLHSTLFFSNEKLHPFIKLLGLRCNYEISETDVTGTCKLEFEFANSGVDEFDELILKLTVLKITSNNRDTTTNQLKKDIIESLEKNKLENYIKYKRDVPKGNISQ